jgi:hypothetical protein
MVAGSSPARGANIFKHLQGSLQRRCPRRSGLVRAPYVRDTEKPACGERSRLHFAGERRLRERSETRLGRSKATLTKSGRASERRPEGSSGRASITRHSQALTGSKERRGVSCWTIHRTRSGRSGGRERPRILWQTPCNRKSWVCPLWCGPMSRVFFPFCIYQRSRPTLAEPSLSLDRLIATHESRFKI